MPAELYTAQKGEDGTVTYVKVDALPEDIVKEHPEYQRVATLKERAVEESKERLRRAQEAEAKLQQTPKEEKQPETPTTQTPAPQTLDKDALYKEFAERLNNERKAEADAAKAVNDEIDALIAKHGLKKVESIRETLTLAGAHRAALAETIGRSMKSFAPVDGGETPVETVEDGGFMKGVYARLHLPE